jgi:DNA-3-methyladenine glycosylase II
MIDGQPVEVAVRQRGGPEAPQLEVDVAGPGLTERRAAIARLWLERMLGAHKDLKPFYALAARDPRLRPLVDEFRGLKPPQFPTVFEGVANGIACQQLSLLVGILLLSRLAHKVGAISANPKRTFHAFPDPTDFSDVKTESLKYLGFSTHKSQALLDISFAIRERGLDLQSLVHLDNQAAIEGLVKLKGVGRWTAEYVLLRALGRLDVFPGDDVGARKKLAHFLQKKKPLDYDGVRKAVAGWQPYAGLVYFHLLLARIKTAGWLSSEPAQDGYARNLLSHSMGTELKTGVGANVLPASYKLKRFDGFNERRKRNEKHTDNETRIHH